jgi:hypothetical protein
MTLECSPTHCDIHDVGMVLDDEDGKRPSGRNPWAGFCLRIDALERIGRPRAVTPDSDEGLLRLGEVLDRLSESLAQRQFERPERPEKTPKPSAKGGYTWNQ